ncbi:cyclin [Penicillium frequentans]|nr:cyclin [Penicillium glabrum]
MDFHLRCNSLKCRARLKEKAVVTTCSHIFCVGCADGLGLSHPTADDRRCPACSTVLSNPDDAVSTVLNPTEDYKTSVLSGLDPNTVMECAGRALGFWAYQSTQEIFYQEFLGKSLTEKYTSLNMQMDRIVLNANSEISSLHSKLSDLQAAQEQLQKKNQELVDLYREKSTKLTQMTNLYNLLKARAMRSRMETAASETVSHTLNTISRSVPVGSLAPSGPSQIPTRSAPLPPKTPSFPMSPGGIEQLHRYQRSGTGSSRRVDTKISKPTGMLPPGRPTLNLHNPHIRNTNPQHRTRLPQSSRPPTALSQLPPDDVIMARFRN